MKQQLSNSFSFAIEPYKERLRLIVYKNEEEFVCRKDSRKNLFAFLLNDETQLFKGRLQLKKTVNTIVIQVKGEAIGEIIKTDFQQLLTDCYQVNTQ